VCCQHTSLLLDADGVPRTAYRYLKRSRLVLFVLTALQLLIFFFFAVDIPNIKSDRTLNSMANSASIGLLILISRYIGTCITAGRLKYIPVSIALTLFESVFICGCCASLTCQQATTSLTCRHSFLRRLQVLQVPRRARPIISTNIG
jgi:hypothetical protein